MSVAVREEKSLDLMCREHCCLCFQLTWFWYKAKDVALCETCAKTATKAAIPDKTSWCAAVRARFPHFDRANPGRMLTARNR